MVAGVYCSDTDVILEHLFGIAVICLGSFGDRDGHLLLGFQCCCDSGIFIVLASNDLGPGENRKRTVVYLVSMEQVILGFKSEERIMANKEGATFAPSGQTIKLS